MACGGGDEPVSPACAKAGTVVVITPNISETARATPAYQVALILPQPLMSNRDPAANR